MARSGNSADLAKYCTFSCFFSALGRLPTRGIRPRLAQEPGLRHQAFSAINHASAVCQHQIKLVQLVLRKRIGAVKNVVFITELAAHPHTPKHFDLGKERRYAYLVPRVLIFFSARPTGRSPMPVCTSAAYLRCGWRFYAFLAAAFFRAGAFFFAADFFFATFLPDFAARSAIKSTACAIVNSVGSTVSGIVALILSHFT